jgi:hypothetical protein
MPPEAPLAQLGGAADRRSPDCPGADGQPASYVQGYSARVLCVAALNQGLLLGGEIGAAVVDRLPGGQSAGTAADANQ